MNHGWILDVQVGGGSLLHSGGLVRKQLSCVVVLQGPCTMHMIDRLLRILHLDCFLSLLSLVEPRVECASIARSDPRYEAGLHEFHYEWELTGGGRLE